jgi:hypothetical protein
MNRFLITAILALLCSGSNLPTASSFPGLLGMSLADAQKTDFFSWFHLEETGREKDSGGRTVVTFKPNAEAFHKLVTVQTTLGAQDQIAQIDLYLARAFVNDRMKRVNANDIAKSMLLDAVPGSDRADIKTLVDEIESNRGSDMQILSARPPAETPVKESPGYLAYLGKRYVYTQQLSSSVLHMENVKQSGEDWIDIQVAVKK